MRNIGRMEWLAFELVIEARRLLLERHGNADDTLWKTIEQKVGIDRAEICVGIAIAPHKMRLTGNEFEASAPGSHKRSDVWLLTNQVNGSEPTALHMAYNASHMFPGMASLDAAQRYPERRILWRAYVPLPGLMEEAASSLARACALPEAARSLATVCTLPPPPSHGAIQHVRQSTTWRKAREWSEKVLSQDVVVRECPGKVPEDDDIGTGIDSDAESDDGVAQCPTKVRTPA